MNALAFFGGALVAFAGGLWLGFGAGFISFRTMLRQAVLVTGARHGDKATMVQLVDELLVQGGAKE